MLSFKMFELNMAIPVASVERVRAQPPELTLDDLEQFELMYRVELRQTLRERRRRDREIGYKCV